jgi:NitT/TauT family transport system permease protein
MDLLSGSAVDLRATRRARLSRRTRIVATRVGCVLVVLVPWQILSATGELDPQLMASPLDIARAIGAILVDGDVLAALGKSVAAFVAAFVIGAVVGLAGGFALGASTLLRAAFHRWVLFWLATPKSAFLPIFVLVFGIDWKMAIAFGAFSAVPYVVVNVVSGVDLVRPLHARTALAFGASAWQRFRAVTLPSALPGIVIGLWHAANRSVGGVLIAELFVAATGVGGLLKTYSATFETDRLMATMILVTMVAIVFAQVWTVLEARVSAWKEREMAAIAP